MKIENSIKTDVLVMGAGISGVMAAIKAGQEQVQVCLVSSSNIFSGSSFYPGTWGFGLIGPEDKEDREDLKNTIKDVGMGMTDDNLVDTLVTNITDGIEELKNWGIPLKEVANKKDQEFIPCFDHKNRNWNGFIQDGAKKVLSSKLAEYEITLMPNTEIIQTIEEGNKVVGAIGINKQSGLVVIECKSFVVASGGLGGLFKYRLNTSDISGVGQYLALNLGAKLVNIEFMQMMVGFISPSAKTIYNEKVYKYSEFMDSKTGESIFKNCEDEKIKRLLEIRSTHGPFTSRLESKEIDFKLFETFMKDESGITLRYKQILKENQPEFIKIYFDWLKESKHLTIDDEVQVGIYSHASNGGIQINSNCETGVKGLFACGEATGGMHGADRIGGLSTANGLVFGRIAGVSAANYAKKVEQSKTQESKEQESKEQESKEQESKEQESKEQESKEQESKEQESKEQQSKEQQSKSLPTEYAIYYIPNARKWIEKIQQMNFETGMIYREEDKILDSIKELKRINATVQDMKTEITEYQESIVSGIIDTYELLACVTLTEHLLHAILLRKESRGSHYRVDYPVISNDYNHPIVMYKGEDQEICYS